MKKNILLFFLSSFCISSTVLAQDFFFKVNGGYAWPGFFNTENVLGPSVNPLDPAQHPNQDLLVNMASFINDTAKSKNYNKPTHGSYGAGPNISLRFGYMVNPYFGVDLGVAYLRSVNISCTQQTDMAAPGEPLNAIVSTPTYLNTTITTYAYGLSVMPSITVTGAKPGKKVYPYARVGLTLPVWGAIIDNVNINVTPCPAYLEGDLHVAPYFLGQNVSVQLKTEATVSVGINGSIGVAYKPLLWMDVFAEVGGQYLNVRGKSSSITKWQADTVNEISARGVYRTQFNFVDQLNSQSNNAAYNPKYNHDKPQDELRPTAPFSNLGFNVGVTFYLSRRIIKGLPQQENPKKS